jgi:hypothetical protein
LRRIVAKGREAKRRIEEATKEALLRQLRAWRRGA